MKLYRTRKGASVICLYQEDSTIIPLRCRFKDEEGIYRTFNIISYTEPETDADGYVPGGMYAGNNPVFDCKVESYGRIRDMRLVYMKTTGIWEVRY